MYVAPPPLLYPYGEASSSSWLASSRASKYHHRLDPLAMPAIATHPLTLNQIPCVLCHMDLYKTGWGRGTFPLLFFTLHQEKIIMSMVVRILRPGQSKTW